jgi:hypothetical protein
MIFDQYLKEMRRKIRNIFVKNPDSERKKRESATKYAKKYANKVKEAFDSGMKKSGTEVRETKKMAASFFKLLEHKLNLNNRTEPPTEEEVREAIEQLKDVGRVSFFASMVILPGGVISLIGLEVLAAKFGLKNFTLIPSSFRKNADWHYPKGYSKNTEDEQKTLGENSDS